MIFEKGLCLRDANPFFVAEGKGGQIVVDPGWIVLTNDDGIDGPGLEALRVATEGLGRRRAVFAPKSEHSGCGHAVTTHAPIAIEARGQGETAVDGTPADCVRVALHRLGPGIAWIVAGINPGGNLGTDIHHSGTVAAVREGAFRGIPGIAISHYVARGRVLDWGLAAARCRRVVSALMARPPGPGRFWNVNLPHPAPGGPEPEIAFCPVDPSPLGLGFVEEAGGLRYRADYQGRPRRPGEDVEVCFGGRISVSLVRVVESVDPPAWPGPDPSGPGII